MTTDSPKQEPKGPSHKEPKRALAGMLIRRECWALSRAAKAIILALAIATIWGAIRFVHPFLAITRPANGDLLVVEAWIPRYGLQQSVTVYRKGSYKRMITSGCARLNDLDGQTASNPAEAAAIQVQRYGMSSGSVTAVPCPVEPRDRTYSTALAVKDWCERNGVSATSIDVVTMGPHARRSRLLFQKAFGNKVKIGVIAIEDISYDPAHWWRSSEGVRDVVGEGIAYVYARIFFHPTGAGPVDSGQNQNAGVYRAVGTNTSNGAVASATDSK